MAEPEAMRWTPELEEELAYWRRATRRAKIALAATVTVVVLLLLFLAAFLLSQPRIPPQLAHGQMPAGKHRVDIVFIDGPELPPEEIDAMLRPLIMVTDLRMPGQSQHFRILVCAEGFPLGYSASQFAAAGYVHEEDLFLVNVKNLRSAWSDLSLIQRWAFAMAHEATHLWQMRRGAMAGRTSNAHNRIAYKSDPIEIEAFEAGLAVANVLPGINFYWEDGNGIRRFSSSPNIYAEFAHLQVAQRADVYMSSQTTPLGVLRSWLRAAGIGGSHRDE